MYLSGCEGGLFGRNVRRKSKLPDGMDMAACCVKMAVVMQAGLLVAFSAESTAFLIR
jgi:hypothetical protein